MRKFRSYRPDYPAVAFAHLRDGGTLTSLAVTLGVTDNTIAAWRRNCADFREAIASAPETAGARGRPRNPRSLSAPPCSAPGCDALSASKAGLCTLHYGRWKKFGSVAPRNPKGAGRPSKEVSRKAFTDLTREGDEMRAAYASLLSPPVYGCARCQRTRGQPTPEAKLVRSRVHCAIRSGKLLRPASCENCQRACKPEAAHFDYRPENALKVRWLCKRCHNAWDFAEPKGGVL